MQSKSKTYDSSKWTWIPCNFSLKTHFNGSSVNLNLTPMIALSHPREDGADPIVKLVVETEKKLQYSENLGWNWHKSWNLPSISATLDVKDPDTKEILYAPKNIFVIARLLKKAHIFAVKAVSDNSNSLHFVDVGLRGTNKVELFDGKATFSTLKFASTSYNNEGVKFHLLIVFYLEIDEGETPKILRAVVSPPIFVDSRKSVRENQKLNESKLYMYIEPFYPDNFTKKFIKRETKKKESIEGDIGNNIEGLYSYLTAPNIRHKVKHPIFMCVRFSDCITLYYNPEELVLEEVSNIPEHLQNLLYQDLENIVSNKDYSIEESTFVLLINKELMTDGSKKKKILEFLGPVKGKGLSIVFSPEEVPAKFVKYENLEALKEQYALAYSKLLSKNRLQFGNDASDLAEPPSNKDEGSEKQVLEISADLDKTPTDLSLFFDSAVISGDPQKKIKFNPEDEPNGGQTNNQSSMVKEEKIEKGPTNITVSDRTSQGINPNLNVNELIKASLSQFPNNSATNLANLTSGIDPSNRSMNLTATQPFPSGQSTFPGMGAGMPQSLDQLSQLMQMNRSLQNKNPYNWMGQESLTSQIPRLQPMQNNHLLQMQQLQNLMKEGPQIPHQLAQQQTQQQQIQLPFQLGGMNGTQNLQLPQQSMEDYLAQIRKMSRDPRFDKP